MAISSHEPTMATAKTSSTATEAPHPSLATRATPSPSSFSGSSSELSHVLSKRPSMHVSTSQHPSHPLPLVRRTKIPSVSPSSFPSIAPTTRLNYLTMNEYIFDIWHHPMRSQDQTERDIIDNVTISFQGQIFTNESSVLYPLVTSHGLRIADSPAPRARG